MWMAMKPSLIDRYSSRLTRLRTDYNRHRWTAYTAYQAPHKPFLLLSIMDHFAQGMIQENFIRPSFELVETFYNYWQALMPPTSKGNMAYPFPRLQNDGIFELLPNPESTREINIESISSMKRLREVCLGARLDDDLFFLLSQTSTREQLRATVVNHYFAQEIRPAVLECGDVNVKAYEYSQDLLKVSEKIAFFEPEEESGRNIRIRDQGFRRAIVRLYEHRCALCGIRMLTPEGHTVVEAAHIKPWSESHDDRPSNGMSLCRLCHWSFDKGLMSVGNSYEVLVSKRVAAENNYPGHIFTLSERVIFKPKDEAYWPGQENLSYHRKTKFPG